MATLIWVTARTSLETTVLDKQKQSYIKDIVSIGFLYMKLQSGFQHTYQLT